MERKEIVDLVSNLVDKFDLSCQAKSGVINGQELKDKLTDWMVKNTKEDKDVRRQRFIEQIRPFVAEYGSDLCNKFVAYWANSKENSLKLPFEKEKSFDIKLRLETFRRNEIKFKMINMTDKLK